MKKELQLSSGALAYHVHGKGQPVMLVHGFGEKSSVWDGQVAALEQHYKLIVPELPGANGSDATHDVAMHQLAAMLNAILDNETAANEQTVVLGHSMGGYATLALAEEFAHRLRGFGLIHSACFADTDEKKETRKKGIRFISEHGAAAFLESTSPNLFSPRTKEDHPALIESFLAGISDLENDQLIDYYEAMMERPDRSKVLTDSKVPVLFVLGRHDTAIPIKDGLKQTTYPELSYIHVLEHSGHMGMLEEKDLLNQILSDFLQGT